MRSKLAVFLFCCAALLSAQPLRAASANAGTALRLPPLLWYESYPARQSSFAMALLLYWSGQDRDEKFRLLAPFYYSSENPDERLRILLPFHFLHADSDGKRVLWGPYYQRDSLKTRTRFLFPLYFSQGSDQGGIAISPLYLRQKNPRYDALTVLPLYWRYQNKLAGGKTWDLLIPFYLRQKSQTERTFYSPFFWSYKDAKVSQGIGIPYYWRNTEDSKSQVVFPVYWRFARTDEEKTRDVEIAVPWFRLRNRERSLRGFVPLYWGRTSYKHDPKSSETVVLSRWDTFLPLYFGFKNPEGFEKKITPFWSRFKDADGTTFGHTGLNFFRRDVWGGKTELFLPLFYYREEPDSFKFYSLAFQWAKTSDGEHARQGIFPLYSWRRDGDRTRFTTPVFGLDRDPQNFRGFFLNYYWKSVKDDSGKEIEKDRALFPLVWSFKDEHESTSVYLPLAAFFKNPEEELSFIIPFYFYRAVENDRRRFIFPVYTRTSPEKKTFSFLFLYWNTHRPDKDTVTILPFYRKSSTQKGASFFLPGFYYLREGNATQGAFFPYFWDGIGKTRYHIFFPLYTDFRRPTWSLKGILLGYRLATKRITETGFFPLWAVTRKADGTGPEFHGTGPDPDAEDVEVSTPSGKHFLADSHRVIPLYLYRRLDRGSDLWLFPILSRFQNEQDAEGYKRFNARYLLIGSIEKSRKRFVNRMDPLFGYERTANRSSFSMPTVPFPLWKYEVENRNDPAARRISGAFFPYYWKENAALRRDLVFPIFYHKKERDPDTLKEEYRVTWLLNYYANKNSKKEKGKRLFVPLYWHSWSADRRWTLVPPVWLEEGDDVSRQFFFPFYWHSRKDTSDLFVLFPLYVRSKDSEDASRSVIVPGFWFSENKDRKSLLALNYFSRQRPAAGENLHVFFPLYWRATGPDRRTQTFFPLFWEWKSKDDTVRYFFPLYFHRSKGDTLATQIIVPVYWRFRTREMDAKIIPPFYSMTSSETGTKTSGVAPLWTHSVNERYNWTDFEILGGLFGYHREGEKKEFSFLYFLKL